MLIALEPVRRVIRGSLNRQPDKLRQCFGSGVVHAFLMIWIVVAFANLSPDRTTISEADSKVRQSSPTEIAKLVGCATFFEAALGQALHKLGMLWNANDIRDLRSARVILHDPLQIMQRAAENELEPSIQSLGWIQVSNNLQDSGSRRI